MYSIFDYASNLGTFCNQTLCPLIPILFLNFFGFLCPLMNMIVAN